jgi:hypothetical protein
LGGASELETNGHFMNSIVWSFTVKLRNVDVSSKNQLCDLWAWCQYSKSTGTGEFVLRIMNCETSQ